MALPMRTRYDIEAASGEFHDKVWYDRQQGCIRRATGSERDEILREMKKGALRLEKEYGKDNLGPYNDFEWGMINGKLSALRWVLGDEWDMLDT